MTQEESKTKSADKVNQIKELCAKLQIRLAAKQIIQNNTIENAVVFMDDEKYDVKNPIISN